MGLESLERITKDSVVDKVTKQIVHYINVGRYRTGSKLPTNDELASMFGVGRSSVRESLKELQTLGIVTLRHGDGTYLCDLSRTRRSTLLEQVIEARRMIEVHTARTSALNPDEEFREQLKVYYEKMCSSRDNESFIYYDRQYHYTLSCSSENILIAKYHTSIDLLFDEVQKSIVESKGSREVAIRDHDSILQSVLACEPEQAAYYTNLHIDHIALQVKEVLESQAQTM